MKKSLSKPRITLKGRDAIYARVFMLPFYLGFILFSVKPLIETFIFIFNSVSIRYGGYDMTYTGIKNLNKIFNEDPDFLLNLFTTVGNMLWQVPSILFISLFLALLIN